MRIWTILFCLLPTLAHSSLEWFQYPEERTYSSSDRGMSPYRSLSLYKSGTFTLTFDDGPHPTRTAKILDVLKKHQTQATFFVLTNLLNEQTYPLIKRMLDEGHTVASHGPGHDNSNTLSESQWKQQVKQSFVELAHWYKKAGYEFNKFYYRYPYGAYGTRADYHHMNALKEVSHELFGENCIQFAFWDVDTADWVPNMSAQEIAQNIIAHNEGGMATSFRQEKLPNGSFHYVKVPYRITDPNAGGVVLQHDIHEANIKATDLFLTYAKARDLRIVPLDEVEEMRVLKNCKL